jgi:hypothetical protein
MWSLNWRTILVAVMIATPPTMAALVVHQASRAAHEAVQTALEYNRDRLEAIHLLVNSQKAELVARNDALLAEIVDLKEQLAWLRGMRVPEPKEHHD